MRVSAAHFQLTALWLLSAILSPPVLGNDGNIFDGDHHDHLGCGFTSPPKKELDQMQQQISMLKRQRAGIACTGCITIDTYIYVFQSPSTGGASFVDDSVIQQQMNILNEAYSNTPFKFRLREANIVVDDYFYFEFFSPAELASKDTLGPSALVNKWPRRGGYSTLNIYYAGSWNAKTLGFAYLPIVGELKTVPFDGVFVVAESLPGGTCPARACGLPGGITIHEVGHWLGLDHVFNSVTGIPCDPNDPNDYVDDTPQMRDFEKGTGFTCPPDSTDTCPLLPGKDPIHNYMDYSSFDCQNQFTPGQIERMYYVWSLYRKSGEKCSTGYKLFEFEILTDRYPLDTTWNLKSTDGDFYWDMDYQTNGIFFGYLSNTLDTQEICLDASKDYVFTIFDNPPTGIPPDGILPPGYYSISYDGKQLKRNSAFGQSEVTSFRGRLDGSTSANIVGCFSGSSLVTVLRGQYIDQVSMRRLQIGDLVQTGVAKFEPVYSFGHRRAVDAQVTEILRIYTSQGGRLELTPDHMVHVKGANGFIASHRVRKGDILQNGSGQDVVVTKIQTIQSRHGMYAPFTPSGEIIVNDVRASTYIAFLGNKGEDEAIHAGWLFSIPLQWLAHASQFPHRVACYHLGSCPDETYTTNGISNWVAGAMRVGNWVLLCQVNDFVGSLVLILAVAILFILSVIERIIFEQRVAVCAMSLVFGCSIVNRLKRWRMTKQGLGPLSGKSHVGHTYT